MKIVFRIITVILFLVFFGFALKNTQEVALQFFLDYELRGPLVLLLLGFFATGTAMGVLAMAPTLFRYRREVARQKRAIAALEKDQQARQEQPAADTVLSIDRTAL